MPAYIMPLQAFGTKPERLNIFS